MEEESISIGAEDKRDIEHLGIGQGLLHASTYGVGIILGLNDGDGDAGFIEKDIICPFILGPGMQLSPDDDSPLGQWKLFTDLGVDIPSRALQGWGDVFGADVAFGEGAFVHGLR